PAPGPLDVVDEEAHARPVSEHEVVDVLGSVDVQLGAVAQAEPDQPVGLVADGLQPEEVSVERDRGPEPLPVLGPHPKEPKPVHAVGGHRARPATSPPTGPAGPGRPPGDPAPCRPGSVASPPPPGRTRPTPAGPTVRRATGRPR